MAIDTDRSLLGFGAKPLREQTVVWLLPVLIPTLTPIAFAIAEVSGMISYGMRLLGPYTKRAGLPDAEVMFAMGWIGLTLLSAGWLAWSQTDSKSPRTERVLDLVALWPLMCVLLGMIAAAGGGIGAALVFAMFDY